MPDNKTSDTTKSSVFNDDDSPAAFSILLGTSTESTGGDPTGMISILIQDDENHCTDRMLLRYSHTHPSAFCKGHTDLFVISQQPSLGNLDSIEIFFNDRENPLENPWKLRSCVVFHHENGKIYNFEIDESKSNKNTFILRAKGDPVQLIPTKLPNPFK
ncbi:unnamed protein product [Caenorhabditis bovis]|uniref:PLAT domain-containing protein n=1 Tax=Caenorhabditis bovis TaxID=2654633 RepID=A0A8S1ETQ2_9PELO|nr:unnamed protein product [Caenorhabditis bovis]